MKLEQIAKQYGMIDYYELSTGFIYHLSSAVHKTDKVLIVDVSRNGKVFGTVRMEAQDGN